MDTVGHKHREKETSKVDEDTDFRSYTGPRLSFEDFQRMLIAARTYQEVDLAEKQMPSKLESISYGRDWAEKGIPLPLVRRVVSDHMEIGEPFVEKALEAYFPSQKTNKEVAESLGALVEDNVTIKTYLETIKNVLSKNFPNEKIKIEEPYSPRIELHRIKFSFVRHETKELRLFGFKFNKSVKRNIPLGMIELISNTCISQVEDCYIYAQAPLFLNAIKQPIEALNKRYNVKLKKVITNYNWK